MGKSIKRIKKAVKTVVKNPTNPKAYANLGVTQVTGGLADLDSLSKNAKGLKGPGSGGAGGIYNPNATSFQLSPDEIAFQQRLKDQSMGIGDPSVAQQQLQTGTNRNIAQLAGAVAASRSSNPALSQRVAMQQQAGATQEAAGQAATLRAQEIQQAQQAYGQNLALQQQRLQDMEALKAGQYQDRANRQANLDSQRSAANKALVGNLVGAGAKVFTG